MRSVLAVFSPNQAVSKKTMYVLGGFWAASLFLVWFNSPFKVLPRPGEVLRAFGNLWMTQGLGPELWTSFMLSLEALAISTALSLVLAYLTVMPAFRPPAGASSKLRFLGLVGLTFPFTLMFGGGRPLKLSLLVFGMTVFFVTSMLAIVAEIPKDKFDHARTLRMNEWRVTWEVVIRGTLDEAIETLRQNAAISWMMLTMVEGISRSEGGVGALLLNQNKHFHLAEVFAIQITIFLAGMLQDYGVGVAKRALCPYASITLERR